MKTTENGKRYDSDKCETLAEREHSDGNNNYSGTSYIVRASDGQLLIHIKSNGQDGYLRNALYVPSELIDFDRYDMDDDQEARCAELGLITIID